MLSRYSHFLSQGSPSSFAHLDEDSFLSLGNLTVLEAVAAILGNSLACENALRHSSSETIALGYGEASGAESQAWVQSLGSFVPTAGSTITYSPLRGGGSHIIMHKGDEAFVHFVLNFYGFSPAKVRNQGVERAIFCHFS